MRRIRLIAATFLATSALVSRVSYGDAKAKQEYGTISGRFLLNGALPRQKYVVAPGSKLLRKYCTSCLKQGIVSEELLVDPKTNGIANIVVYLRKAPVIHPKLRVSAVKEVQCQFKSCRLRPHVMLARTDQTILVKNFDQCGHNVHPQPLAQKQHY